MSRFIEKLQRVNQAAAQPLGFRPGGAAAAAPRILLVASLEPADTVTAADVEGADAVLLRPVKASLTAEVIQKTAELLGELPWGAYLEDGNDKKTATLVAAGCDFMVFPADSPIFTLPPDNDEVGTILQVESSMDDGLLRAVNNLVVDAILVADSFEGGSLIWHQLMVFRHLTNMITKPLLLPVPADVSETDLKALWDVGFDGVVVDTTRIKPGGLQELRRLIDKLPARTTRKHGKAEALLPRSGGEPQPAAIPDEEEEDEE